MSMLDSAPDNSSSTPAEVPWESIGDKEEAVGGRAALLGLDGSKSPEPTPTRADAQLPLTPWAEPPAVPEILPVVTEESPNLDADPATEPAWTEIVKQAEEAVEAEPEPAPAAMVPAAPESGLVRGGGWTIPVLCAGIALIACCVLIPQADANRRLAYDREVLQRDLGIVERQVAVNAEFLKKVADDPTLAERLAERQMKVIPEGSHVLNLIGEPESSTMSPFQLVRVAPPAPLPRYKPVGGALTKLCYGTHSRLYLIGISLGMIAAGLVLGYAPEK